MTREEIMLRASCLQESFNATNELLADARQDYIESGRKYDELRQVVEVFRIECNQLLVCMKAQAWAAGADEASPPAAQPALPEPAPSAEAHP